MVTPAPGDAIVHRHEDGTITVEHADPVIRVSPELLADAEPWAWDGTTLTLDTAGEYRYRAIGLSLGRQSATLLFERIP